MGVKHNFRKLEIWEKGISLVKETYSFTSSFPKSELYGLSSQMQRCAVSIPSNIAEGCAKSTRNHTIKYIETALGSAYEWETQLIISYEVGFIAEDKYKALVEQIRELQRKVAAFIEYLKKERND